jgi:hypothetical protein
MERILSYIIITPCFLVGFFDLKHGKVRQDQARRDVKVTALPGQEMADSGKAGLAIFF